VCSHLVLKALLTRVLGTNLDIPLNQIHIPNNTSNTKCEQILRDHGPFSGKSHSKLLFLLRSSKKTKQFFFLEYNHKILYFTCLRSCGKIFMKFDGIDWKILAFKVRFFFLNSDLQFQMTLITICGIFLHYGFLI